MRLLTTLAVFCLFLVLAHGLGWLGGGGEERDSESQEDELDTASQGVRDANMHQNTPTGSGKHAQSHAKVKRSSKGSSMRQAREIVPDMPIRSTRADSPADAKANEAILKLETAVGRVFSMLKSGSGSGSVLSSTWNSGVENVDSSIKRFVGQDAYFVLAKKCFAVAKQGWDPVLRPVWKCVENYIVKTVMSAVSAASTAPN